MNYKELESRILKDIPYFRKNDFVLWKNTDNEICIQAKINNELFGHEYLIDFENKKLIPLT